jgi:hypothetical protein
MTTPIRFYTDTVTTREHVGCPVGSQQAAQAIERVKQQMRPKRGRTPQGISLVDARTAKKEVGS